jgi:hypothetical protein
MSRIHLTTNLDAVDAPRGEVALWVYGNRGRRPLASRCVTVTELLDRPGELMRGIRTMVVVGLVSEITTPGNRVRTGKLLTDPLPGVERISIDDRLFTADPWRLWWHFGCVGVWFGGHDVSYALEGRWNRYVEGAGPNPCTPEEIVRYGDGVVIAERPFHFETVTIRVVQVDPDDHARYQAEKAAAFAQETTATKIISRLARFADEALPERSVPSTRDLFKSRSVHVVATDLGVDQFLTRGIRERIDLTNFIAEHFQARR